MNQYSPQLLGFVKYLLLQRTRINHNKMARYLEKNLQQNNCSPLNHRQYIYGTHKQATFQNLKGVNKSNAV